MDAQSLAILVAKMTVFLLAAAILAATLRRASAGARHQVWLVTLAGVLALPVLLALAPVRLAVLPEGLGLSPAPESAPTATRLASPPRDPHPSSAAGAALRPAGRAVPSSATRPPFPWPSARLIAARVWAVVALALVGWLAAGRLAVRRIVRAARPLEGPRVKAMTCELADRLDLARLPAVLASDRTDMPFATGFWHTTIVLPAAASAWTEERLRVVLLHELAHVRRRDLVGHTVSRLACAVYWFHPLVWAAARRLRDESEKACDDLVLASGARASDYAGHLLDIVAAARRGATPAIALPMGRRREFEGRVLAILDPRERRAPGRRQSAMVLGGLGLVFFLVAASAPSQPAAPVSALMTVAIPAAEPAAAQAATPAPAPAVAAGEARPVIAIARAQEGRPTAEATGASKPESRALLVRVLRTDTEAEVRKAAAWALAEADDADAVHALLAALAGDADDEVRETAAWALSDNRGEDVRAALAAALRKDESAEVRKTAAWALGQGSGKDTAALVAATADRDPEVREVAIWALGQHRTDKAPTQIVTALGDGEPSVRLVAAWALGEILDPATVPAVKAAFAKETDDEVRLALFRALAFLGDLSRETLEHALAAKDPELRSHAVQMLAGGGPGVWPWAWPRPEPRPNP